MPWRRAHFKGQKVWAEVEEDGSTKILNGKVSIRYQPTEGAKLYSTMAQRLRWAEERAEELPPAAAPGQSKPVNKRKSSGFGKAGTRTAEQAQRALHAAQDRLKDLPEGMHVAFTDGACRGNPGPSGCGAVLRLADGRRIEGERSLGQGTNNIAELSAVGLALELLSQAEVSSDDPVLLLTDSRYTLGVLSQGWKAKANRELILGLRERLQQWPHLEIEWVAGHVGIAENERADALANQGLEKSRSR